MSLSCWCWCLCQSDRVQTNVKWHTRGFAWISFPSKQISWLELKAAHRQGTMTFTDSPSCCFYSLLPSLRLARHCLCQSVNDDQMCLLHLLLLIISMLSSPEHSPSLIASFLSPRSLFTCPNPPLPLFLISTLFIPLVLFFFLPERHVASR